MQQLSEDLDAAAIYTYDQSQEEFDKRWRENKAKGYSKYTAQLSNFFNLRSELDDMTLLYNIFEFSGARDIYRQEIALQKLMDDEELQLMIQLIPITQRLALMSLRENRGENEELQALKTKQTTIQKRLARITKERPISLLYADLLYQAYEKGIFARHLPPRDSLYVGCVVPSRKLIRTILRCMVHINAHSHTFYSHDQIRTLTNELLEQAHLLARADAAYKAAPDGSDEQKKHLQTLKLLGTPMTHQIRRFSYHFGGPGRCKLSSSAQKKLHHAYAREIAIQQLVEDEQILRRIEVAQLPIARVLIQLGHPVASCETLENFEAKKELLLERLMCMDEEKYVSLCYAECLINAADKDIPIEELPPRGRRFFAVLEFYEKLAPLVREER